MNDALLKTESHGDMRLAMGRFAECVSRTCHIPRSDLFHDAVLVGFVHSKRAWAESYTQVAVA